MKPPAAPRIVAHRGLHDDLPENSRGAFLAAWERGIDWAECDIQFSADGIPVVLHDDTLDRTTAASGPARQRPWSELQNIPLRTAPGQTLPSLAQILQDMPPSAGLFVEVKPLLDLPVMESLLGLLAGARCLLQSFHPENLALARRLAPHLPLALLVHSPAEIPPGLDPVAFGSAIHLDHQRLAPGLCRRLHDQGLAVGAWTVNLEAEIRRAMAEGVDTLITDRPPLAARIRAEPRI